MANISSYLAAIMAAVYGEDVRGSIHDAIDIINKVGEVVLNTGTAVTSPTSSSTGFYDGSFYINTNTMELWKCIGTDSWQSQGILKGADGADGNGIASIVKTATVGLVDTYTITFDDGSTETYQITNGQNGSKWYKGTAISGTGTSITGFPGVINDFYLNSADGYVYVCTKTGGSLLPDAAEWDYVMTLTGGGGTSVTVIDNLTSSSSTDALSANQGRVLKGMIEAIPSMTVDQTYDGTSANAQSGVAVKQAIDSLDGVITGSAGAGKTLTAFSQADGKVNATFENISITKSQISDFPSIPSVAVNYSPGSASSTVVKSQYVQIDNVQTDIDGTAYMENTANSASFVFTNSSYISSNSAIDVYTDTWGDNPSNVVVDGANHTCTVTFSAAQSRTVRIYIK